MTYDFSFLKKKKFYNVYLFFFFLIISFSLYFRSLNNFFVLDDFTFIKASSAGSLAANFHFFPIPLLIYRIVYLIFGLNPVPVRCLNLVLNASVCVVVCNLSYRIFQLFGKEEDDNARILKSFLCGLIFSLLFIHVETVIYFSELHEMLFTLFYALALYFYFTFRLNKQRKYSIFLILFYALSLFSKESAVTLVLCIFLSEIFLFKNKVAGFLSGYYHLLGVTFLFVLIRLFFFSKFDKLDYTFNLIAIVKEIFKNIVFAFTAFWASLDFTYLKDLYKTGDADIVIIFKSVLEHYPVAIVVVLISFLLYILMFIKRDKIISVSFVFIFIAISSFVWLTGYERYMYLPSIGFCIMIIQFSFKTPAGSRNLKIFVFALLIIFSLYNIYSLIQKEENWKRASEISFETISQIVSITKELPAGSEVYFKDLPGDYKGAWILRDGIHEVPEFFVKRNDIKFYYFYEMPVIEKIPNNVYVYDYSDGKIYAK